MLRGIAGAFLLLVTVILELPACGETIDYVAAGVTALLGLLLIGLRTGREITGSKDLSTLLIASLPPSGAGGLIELGAMAPIAYFGLRKVFNNAWVYMVPIASFVTGFAVLALAAGIVT